MRRFLILFTLYFFSGTSDARDLAVPLAPLNLTAVAVSSSQITLTWQDASLDETGFEVEASNDGKTFIKIAELPVNSVTYASVGLPASAQFWYRVRAENASGFSAYSNIASAVTKVPVATIPKAPENLLATVVSGTQINLAWTDQAADETGFELERSLDGTAFVKIADLAANASAFQDTGLTPVTKYWYRVLAKNTAGKSAYSNIVSATTLQVVPAAPENLTGSAVSASQINLSWLDKANNETGFQIERSADGVSFLKIADLAVNATSYQNTGLAVNSQYYYRVRALNAASFSTYSNVVSVRTQNIPVPDMPKNLTAVPVAPELIQLRWDPITGSPTETVIERASKQDDVFRQIGKVAANILQFEDKGKLESTDYYYRIKAVNGGGSSPYSLISLVRAASIITGVEPEHGNALIYAFGKTLVVTLDGHQEASLVLYDAKGVRHAQYAVSREFRVDLNALPSGIYVAVVESSKEVISRRILLY
jgi:fibronectin type 3 domain-containing protein